MNKNRKEILRLGLPWGLGMFVIMTIIIPWMNAEPIPLKKILISFPLWMLGGLLFGYCMNRWLPRNR
jgi:hypothetical protein